MVNLVAVTGGIGAGKSTVLAALDRRGQRTLDSDAVVHRLYRPGSPLCAALAARWGVEILDGDGAVNRAAVAAKVFADAGELEWLNRLVHPAVKAEIRGQAAAAGSLLFCAIPLLFEVGWETEALCTLAVWCDRRTQRERLRRRGWNAAEIERREAAQLSMDDKLERADFAVINHGGRERLDEQIARILQRIAPLPPPSGAR
ncbi:MAG: Dephospho-CoA kinase [Lentisphaerae bacterium ADurb.BinA184]|nr:MAG: Dephospho-CoA kinase [Lentisphaerae bacterium ADurb.BinA184]